MPDIETVAVSGLVFTDGSVARKVPKNASSASTIWSLTIVTDTVLEVVDGSNITCSSLTASKSSGEMAVPEEVEKKTVADLSSCPPRML